MSLSIKRQPITIQGKKASDLEARWATSAAKNKLPFLFLWKIERYAGKENQIDFIFPTLRKAVEIDGEIAHKSARKKGDDVLRDYLLRPYLRKLGISPDIIRVPFNKLKTQAQSDRTFRELLL